MKNGKNSKEREVIDKRAVVMAAKKLHADWWVASRSASIEPESFFENWSRHNLVRCSEKFRSGVFKTFLFMLREGHNG